MSRFEFTRSRNSLRKCGFGKSVIARNTVVLDYSRQDSIGPGQEVLHQDRLPERCVASTFGCHAVVCPLVVRTTTWAKSRTPIRRKMDSGKAAERLTNECGVPGWPGWCIRIRYSAATLKPLWPLLPCQKCRTSPGERLVCFLSALKTNPDRSPSRAI